MGLLTSQFLEYIRDMEEYSFAKSTDLDIPVHVRMFVVSPALCSAHD